MPWGNRFIMTETFTNVACGNGLTVSQPAGLVATIDNLGSDMVVDIVVIINSTIGEARDYGTSPRAFVRSYDDNGDMMVRIADAVCHDYEATAQTYFVVKDVYIGNTAAALVYVECDTYAGSAVYSGHVEVMKASSQMLMEQLDANKTAVDAAKNAAEAIQALAQAGGNGDLASIRNTVQGNYSELVNNVGTALTSINIKTTNLPSDPAGVSNLPVAPDNTGIAAIQAKTDQLAFSGSDVLATLDSEAVKLAADGWDSLAITEPSGDPDTWTVPQKLMWLVMRFMNKHTSDNYAGITVHKSDDTVSTSQVVTEVSGVKSVGKAQ